MGSWCDEGVPTGLWVAERGDGEVTRFHLYQTTPVPGWAFPVGGALQRTHAVCCAANQNPRTPVPLTPTADVVSAVSPESAFLTRRRCPLPQVAMLAVDSLRQLAMKFLARDELANYQFQNDFLKPFVVVMRQSPNVEIRELIIRCVSQMVLARHNNIKVSIPPLDVWSTNIHNSPGAAGFRRS